MSKLNEQMRERNHELKLSLHKKRKEEEINKQIDLQVKKKCKQFFCKLFHVLKDIYIILHFKHSGLQCVFSRLVKGAEKT